MTELLERKHTTSRGGLSGSLFGSNTRGVKASPGSARNARLVFRAL